MSCNNVPSKVDVMGWNQQSLADYMRKQMASCELQVFPSLYVPIITKIQSDINQGEQKRAFGQKSKAQKYPKQVLPAQQEEVWDSDEFDYDSDPDNGGGVQEEDGYICAQSEPQDADDTYESYETPPSANTLKPPPPPRVQQSHNTDAVPEPIPAKRKSKAAYPRTTSNSLIPQRPALPPQPNLHLDRSKKPSQTDVAKSIEGSAVKAPGSFTGRIPKPRIPRATDVFNRISKRDQVPSAPTKPAPVESIQKPTRCIEGLDPSWYGGKVTRREAEAALREMNKDGAFVVRDSSQGALEQPYTLMLLKQGKVYNIMIRNQGNSYSLGTGLKTTKSFPGVKEMIAHHTHTPLLLIDATDRSSEAQNQCCLLHPAGLGPAPPPT
ncbi:lymphocyte cytosolic protein 2 [Notothenia coriiceps]|uniref:Lymphocyte cytosolic protein 2 n=1 Tax=Notothenia coriiceps TaxID=8208 RepID=A0A6I9N6Q7_9TELE|nr:PREDICTED: lymphocyte cytosolic protein 2-like [Notothenia coriiceps]